MFLHGSAAQFETHTRRMLELEQEYLPRFPKRTWQGHEAEGDAAGQSTTRCAALLQAVADAGGRMHKLEVHQLARRVGPASAPTSPRSTRPSRGCSRPSAMSAC